jgi:hypothetical protein
MHSSRRIPLALGAVCLALSVHAAASLAAEPATVTVRVEGFNGATLLSQTQVTTSTAPVPVEGGTCSGTSAGGALYDATHGDWKAKAEAEGVAILGIEGVDLPPFGPGNYAYWAIWLNNGFAQNGACAEELGPNADLVFVGQCFALGLECPSSETAPDHFLTMAPSALRSVSVGVREPVSVTVGSLGTATGAPEALPAGVAVIGGATPVSPSPQGVATLEFSAAGTYTLQARAPDAVPSDPLTVCVHDGNDGTCGTASPSAPATPGSGVAGAHYAAPGAIVARATGPLDGRVYTHAGAPRLLRGTVDAPAGLKDVEARLTRRRRGRRGRVKCSYYDGRTERFRAMRCGASHGRFFSVGDRTSFSYLLPASLRPGRYVLDLRASDGAGDRTRLARGTSRIVFYVA